SGAQGDDRSHVSRGGSDSGGLRVLGGRFVLQVIAQSQDGRNAPLFRGSATKANPAKAGDAKLRGYRTPSRATPVGLPNLPGGVMCFRVTCNWAAPAWAVRPTP